MVKAVVGGRDFEFEKEDIERRMRGIQPEQIRDHVVELLDTVYPPKQVVATVTGWPRTSFTTLEAQRVLTRAGFVCRRAGQNEEGRPAWMEVADHEDESTVTSDDADSLPIRVAHLEDALTVAQAAIASLVRRIEDLEQLDR